MNAAIVQLTFRQLLGQRRSAMMLLFALLPIGIAVIYRLSADTGFIVDGSDGTVVAAYQQWAATTLFGGFIIGLLLPLAALIFGTAALGSEFDDGTAPYLLGKPIPRWRIVLSKLFVAWIATAAIVTAVIVASGIVALAGQPTSIMSVRGAAAGEVGTGYGIIAGFAAAGVIGALLYTAIFILVSVVTSRAFIVGLIYVFLWEGLVTRIFDGVRIFSVLQYTLSLAAGIGRIERPLFDPQLGFAAAIVLTVVVAIGATWLAIRRLERWEIGEAG